MNPTGPAQVTAPALLGLGAMALLGASAGVSAHLRDFPLLGGQAVRYLVAAAILAALAAAAGRAPAGRWSAGDLGRLLALAATGLVGFNICLMEALRHADPAAVGSVVGCTPLLLALLGPVRSRRRPSARLLGAATLVVVGAALTQGFGPAGWTGLAFALGALAGEVAFSLLAVGLLPRFGAIRVSAAICAAATVMFGLAALASDGPAMLRPPTAGELAALGYLTVVLTVGAFLLWYTALPALGAARAGLLAGVVPVTAAGSQVVLGMGWPEPVQLAGVLLVGLGIPVGLATTAPP